MEPIRIVTVYAFGNNSYGQIGIGTQCETVAVPQVILGLRGKKIAHISAGAEHSIVLTEDGEVFAWGRNDKSQCGPGVDEDAQTIPIRLSPLPITHYDKAVLVGCGYNHSFILTRMGHLYQWGDNSEHQLGFCCEDPLSIPVPPPRPEVEMSGRVPRGRIASSAVSRRSIATTDTAPSSTGSRRGSVSDVFMFDSMRKPHSVGMDSSGSTQRRLFAESNTSQSTESSQKEASNLRKSVSIQLGLNAAYGSLPSTPSSNTRTATQPTASPPIARDRATPVLRLDEDHVHDARFFQVEESHARVLTLKIQSRIKAESPPTGVQRGGRVDARPIHLPSLSLKLYRAFQEDKRSDCPNEQFCSSATYVQLPGPVTYCYAGAIHSIAMLADNTACYWGGGKYQPCIFSLKGSPVFVKQVVAGLSHLIALTVDGLVYTWGDGRDGRLGHNNCEAVDAPRLVKHIAHEKISQVAAGGAHSVAVTKSGHAYVWGWNRYGQLGIGTLTNQLRPTHLHFPGQKVKDVTLGACHSVYLSETGELFACGDSQYGQTAPLGGLHIGGRRDTIIPADERLQGKHAIQREEHAAMLVNLTPVARLCASEQIYAARVTAAREQIVKVVAGGYHTIVVTEMIDRGSMQSDDVMDQRIRSASQRQLNPLLPDLDGSAMQAGSEIKAQSI